MLIRHLIVLPSPHILSGLVSVSIVFIIGLGLIFFHSEDRYCSHCEASAETEARGEASFSLRCRGRRVGEKDEKATTLHLLLVGLVDCRALVVVVVRVIPAPVVEGFPLGDTVHVRAVVVVRVGLEAPLLDRVALIAGWHDRNPVTFADAREDILAPLVPDPCIGEAVVDVVYPLFTAGVCGVHEAPFELFLSPAALAWLKLLN